MENHSFLGCLVKVLEPKGTYNNGSFVKVLDSNSMENKAFRARLSIV